MANEVNANIRVDVDTSSALASLRQLQSQISRFNQSVITSNSQAAATQQSMLSTMRAQIGATGQFTTSLTNVTTGVSRLQGAIDKNRLSLGEYFRYGAASSKTFGKMFGKEHAEVMALATERVRKLQTQYIGLGEASGGMTRAMAVRPVSLFNADMAIGIQRSQLFNKLLTDGTTKLLNFGKNTQWAGRQLMVGFTIPLSIFGATASRVFMDLEKQAINFKKVYGDIFTTDVEVEQALDGIKELSLEFTKYGIAVKDSMALAGIAAQAGFRNDQLIAATTQATRLSVLGQMEQQEAMKTTISLQTAFGLSNEQLADAVNFLNITENQSVLSLQDVAGAIPRVAPVINALGGDVKDLAVLLVAMKEGGVSAAEGANALKNSLGRLIVPTSKASGMARDFGIDLEGIVTRNKGQVMPMLAELAQAMQGLEGLAQQQLLSTIFGKFQYARVGALFKSLQDDASQANRILQLTGMSTEQLAETAEKELGVVEEAVGTKFVAAMERAKVAIAPIGEQFLKLATPILNVISGIFEKFNELSPNIKNFVTLLVGGLGIITPVFIMLIGLTANFVANIAKGLIKFGQFMAKLKGGGDAVNYLSNEQLEAAAAAASLEGRTTSLTSAINAQASALSNLTGAYGRYIASAQAAAANLPQGFRAATPPTKMARGGMVGGTGRKDSEPALLMPGEFVINADASKQFAPLLTAINQGKVGKYADGRVGRAASLQGGQELVLGPAGILAPGNVSGGFGMSREFFRYGQQFEESLRATAIAAAGMETKTRLTRDAVTKMSTAITPHTTEITNILRQTEEKMRSTGQEASHISDVFKTARPQIESVMAKMKSAGGTVAGAAEGVRQLAYPTEEDFFARGERRVPAATMGGRTTYYRSRHSALMTRARGAYEKLTGKPVGRSMTMAHVVPESQKLLGRNLPLSGGAAAMSPEATAQQRAYIIQRSTQDATLYGTTFAETSRKQGAASGKEFVNAMGSETKKAGQEVGKNVIAGANAASPPPWSRELGTWVAQGIKQGATTQLKLMPEEIRRTISQGVVGPTSPIRRPLPVSVAGQYFGGSGDGGDGGGIGGVGGAGDDLPKAINNAAVQTNRFSLMMASTRGRLATFGNALRNGSGKLTGATMGLSGLAFGLSMMDNSVGEAAKKMMPFIFGLTAVQQILPMLLTPWGALVAAVSAVGISLYLLDKKTKEMRNAGTKYVQAMVGSTKKIEDIGKAFGTQTATQQLAEILSRPLAERKPDEETITKAMEFVQSETGKALIKDIEDVSKTSGIEEGVKALRLQLQRAILSGVIDIKTAKEIAIAFSQEINNKEYSIGAIAQLNEILGPDGNKLETVEGRIQIVADIVGQLSNISDIKKIAQEQYESAGFLGQFALRRDAGTVFTSEQDTQAMMTGRLMGAQASESMLVQREEMNRQLIEMLNTNASFEEYLKNNRLLSEELSKQSQGWQSQIDLIKQTYGETNAGRLAIEGLEEDINKTSIAIIRQSVELEKSKKIEEVFKRYKKANGEFRNEIEKGFVLNIQTAINAQTVSADSISTFFERLEKLPAKRKTEIEVAISALDDFQSGMFFSLLETTDGKMNVDVLLDVIKSGNEKELYDLYATAQALSAAEINPKIILSLPKPQQQAALKSIQKTLAEYDSLDLENKEVVTTFLEENFDLTKAQLDTFLSLEPVTRRRVVVNFSTIGSNLLNDQRFVAEQNAIEYLRGLGYSDARLRTLQRANKLDETQEAEILKGEAAKLSKGPKTPEPEGGGSKTQSWLQKFLADLEANSRLYLDANKAFPGYLKHRGDFLGYLTKLRGMGASEQLLQELSEGEEGVAQAQELFALGAKGLKKLSSQLPQVQLGAFMSKQLPFQRQQLTAKRDAENILKREVPEIPQNIIQGIASNTEQAMLLVQTAAQGSKKELKGLINGLLELQTLSSTPQEAAIKVLDDSRKAMLVDFDRQQARFKQAFGELDRQYQPGINASKKIIEGLQEQIELVQKQIDEIENLNKSDQDRIRVLERQKEMLNRQIEAAERQNELDERKAETLKRQDEIRSRVGEAISKDLEIVSQQEEKIRDAYDKRFKALDKIGKVNDYLINQQKQQLNLSRAISEGDIYAATAAAQEMRAASAQFSVEQTRAGLEAGMEGQIAGLRTAGGLTREQAEEQIRQIKEQSYQTSLLIRDIEDKIYDRNLTLIPIKDQIRSIDDQIRSINDIIYDRETQVLQIQREKLDPLTGQLKLQQDILKNNERDLADAKAAVQIEGLTYEQLQNQIDASKEQYDVQVALIKTTEQNVNAADNLLKVWQAITKQIEEANNVAKNQKIGAVAQFEAKQKRIQADVAKGSITAKQGGEKIAIAQDRLNKQLATFEQERANTTSQLLQSGANQITTQGKYMGGLIKMGMGGKMKRYPMGGLIPYAMGGVAGDGARDSVLAKLTPGEFVIRKAMVKKYGDAMMRDINMGSFSAPRYNTPMMGDVKLEKVQNNNMIAPVYNNYDMDFTISGANASADEIANKVMFKMKQVQSSAIRTNRG